METGEEEDDEDDDEEEATTNKIDLKWIHDEDDDGEEEFDGEEDEEEGVWLRLKAFINGFCCINI